MRTNTRDKILGYIRTHKQARVHDLVQTFKISRVAIHKQLKLLLRENTVEKVGKPPLVFYVPATKKEEYTTNVPVNIVKVIEDNYLYISPKGELLYGFDGFQTWVRGIKEEHRLYKLAEEYVKTLDDLNGRRSASGWIDATKKLKNTFTNTSLDKLLYSDFYSIPKFGKTKLGQLVLYAKQSQNIELIDKIADLVKPTMSTIIDRFSIDAIAFVPPTVPRSLQFVEELERSLSLNTSKIKLVKVSAGEVAIAQKTLSRLDERVENARSTIFPKTIKGNSYNNVLLVDDAVGSGATFNETAKKLKSSGICKKRIVAFAIVGSLKGFDVIREV